MKIAIFGTGVMGEAFVSHFVKNHEVILYDKSEEKSSKIARKHGAKSTQSIEELLKECQIVLLSVKPKDLSIVASQISSFLTPSHIIISILAGTSLQLVQEMFPKSTVVRVMPNLPIVCQKGVLGVVQDNLMNTKIRDLLSTLFEGIGLVVWIPEQQMDAITALTGSGPAFILLWIEAMMESAIAMGLSTEKSRDLVLQTMLGTLELCKTTGKHPAELKWLITSPGGTTIEGLKELEKAGVRSGIMNAFLATYQKSRKFGD